MSASQQITVGGRLYPRDLLGRAAGSTHLEWDYAGSLLQCLEFVAILVPACQGRVTDEHDRRGDCNTRCLADKQPREIGGVRY